MDNATIVLRAFAIAFTMSFHVASLSLYFRDRKIPAFSQNQSEGLCLDIERT
jgi:hypothetical protein